MGAQGQKPRRPEDFDEDCLSDSWVASDRLAWIDLTAGPFTWGPSAGGVGARTHATLPSVSEMVEDYYTPVDDTYEQPQGGTDQEGFLDFVNQIQAERDVVHMLHKRHCAGWRSRTCSAQFLCQLAPTLFRPFLAHFSPFFPHFFAVLPILPPRFRKPAPRPGKTVRNGRKTAGQKPQVDINIPRSRYRSAR